MNILFLSRWFPFPADNGSRQRIAALLAALAALLPTRADAAITKPTSSFYQINGTAPVSGLKLTGYDGKTVYVAIQVTGQATVSIPTKAQTGLALPFGYTSWSGSQIAFTGPVANANAALAAMTIVAGNVAYIKNSTANDVTLNLTAFDNSTGAAYNPANQHFYRYVPGKITGTDALAAAAAAPATLGQAGYLASITSADENAFVVDGRSGRRRAVLEGLPSLERWSGLRGALLGVGARRAQQLEFVPVPGGEQPHSR